MAHMKGNMTLKKGNMALMKGNMALTKGNMALRHVRNIYNMFRLVKSHKSIHVITYIINSQMALP